MVRVVVVGAHDTIVVAGDGATGALVAVGLFTFTLDGLRDVLLRKRAFLRSL